MTFQVRLDIFEGPLDLLLHLIKRDQMNIYDIPIARLADQYLEYIRAAQQLNLEVTGEFLVMAATLMLIKTRMLLPKPAPEPDEEEVEEDPEKLLIRQLVDYSRFKQAAAELAEREGFGMVRAGRPPQGPPGDAEEPFVTELTVYDLVVSYKQMLAALVPPSPSRIVRDQVKIEDKMREITARLSRSRSGIRFSLLIRGLGRLDVVVSFLALLELVRQRRVVVQQPMPFGDLTIYGSMEGDESA